MPEQELLGYRPITLIAKRRFSSLYLTATHTLPQQQIVIKLFDGILLEKYDEHQKFLADVENLKALSHPSILAIQDTGVERLQPYIISPYMEEGSLRIRLNQLPLSLEQTLKLIQQIGHALSYAHSQNVLHGSIKPENILFDEQKNGVLADFYLPSLRQETQKMGLFPDARSMGYMAPETFHGVLLPQSDQYSLACLAFEMIVGSIPFPALSFTTSQSKHDMLAPPSLKSFIPTLPDHIEAAIHKAMSKEPDERYQDIEAFMHALILSAPEDMFTTAEPARISALPVLLEHGIQEEKSVSIDDSQENIFAKADIQTDMQGIVQSEREGSRLAWPTEKTGQVLPLPVTPMKMNGSPTVNEPPDPGSRKKNSNTAFSLLFPLARFQHTRANMTRIIAGAVVLVLISLLVPLFLLPQFQGQNHENTHINDLHCGTSTTCFIATRDGQSHNVSVSTPQSTPFPYSQRNIASPSPTPRGTTSPTATQASQTVGTIPQPPPIVASVPQPAKPTPVPTQIPVFYSVGNSSSTLSGGAKLVPCDLCQGNIKSFQVGSGATLTMNDIPAARTGTFAMTIDYINGDSQPRIAYLSINGGASMQVSFPSTGTWNTDTPGSVTIQATLQAGMNSIEFFNANAFTPDFAGIII